MIWALAQTEQVGEIAGWPAGECRPRPNNLRKCGGKCSGDVRPMFGKWWEQVRPHGEHGADGNMFGKCWGNVQKMFGNSRSMLRNTGAPVRSPAFCRIRTAPDHSPKSTGKANRSPYLPKLPRPHAPPTARSPNTSQRPTCTVRTERVQCADPFPNLRPTIF